MPIPKRLGDLLHLVEVGVRLAAGLVQGLERRAAQLELAARLQADVAALLGERDRVAVLKHRLPAEPCGQRLEQGADAARPLIGQRAQVVAGEAELLVLGADPPGRARLAALLQILDQLTLAGDRLALAARRCRHQVPFFSPSLRPAAPAGPQRRRHSAALRAPQQMLHTEPAPPTVGECVANAFMVRCQGPVLARWSSSIRQE